MHIKTGTEKINENTINHDQKIVQAIKDTNPHQLIQKRHFKSGG